MPDRDSALHREAILGRSWWQPLALGIVLILAGLFMLRNAIAATVISAIVLGIALLGVGIFEIVYSFWAPHWGGFFRGLLVGAFYAIGGAVLVADPLAASVLLTLVFAAAMIASGAVRIFLAVQDWEPFGWLLLASGIVGILAGLVILAKWPLSGLWVFGLVVGIDLLLHGISWVLQRGARMAKPKPTKFLHMWSLAFRKSFSLLWKTDFRACPECPVRTFIAIMQWEATPCFGQP